MRVRQNILHRGSRATQVIILDCSDDQNVVYNPLQQVLDSKSQLSRRAALAELVRG